MSENRRKIRKDGWNWHAFFFSVFWYYKNGIIDKAIIMTVFILLSLGIGLIPIAIYSGVKGNSDRYIVMKKNVAQ